MHRFERRVAWVSVALLAVCALGATSAAWPSNVNEQADAVVQHVVSQSNVHAATRAHARTGTRHDGRPPGRGHRNRGNPA